MEHGRSVCRHDALLYGDGSGVALYGNSWNRWHLWDCSSLFQRVWCWGRAGAFLDDCPVCLGNAAWLVLLRRSCRSIFGRRAWRSLVSLGILLCGWIGSSGNTVNHLDILRPCKWIDGDSELAWHLAVIPKGRFARQCL